MAGKKDIWVIAVVLLLAAALFMATYLPRMGQTLSGTVAITVDGQPYATLRLDENGEVRIAREGGQENLIAVENGAVRMVSSTCQNQLCVHQGAITAENWARRALGRTIVCLPHRVMAEVLLDQGHPTLEDPDAPDITI
ncbi:MAG: NusG domain II-containing protein [Oscillospiraceae bacterium]|nr:NusG domain II-containing protein [Oscillospiraceae bacterium]